MGVCRERSNVLIAMGVATICPRRNFGVVVKFILLSWEKKFCCLWIWGYEIFHRKFWREGNWGDWRGEIVGDVGYKLLAGGRLRG